MRGGKRDGAGRPTGTRWKPATKAFRADAVEKAAAIVNQDADPLTIVTSWIADPSLDMSFRLSAANTALPFLYPKLSASSVDARVTTTKVDSSDLLRRIDERLSKIAQPVTLDSKSEEPSLMIEVNGEDEDEV